MSKFCTHLLVFGMVLATAGAVHAGRGLVEHSPFLPPDFNPSRSSAPAAEDRPSTPIERQLEFKGWYEINGEIRVLISQRQEGGGGWMRVGESRDSISVLDFDPRQEQVRARYQNSEGWLTIAKLESNPSGSGSATARDRRAAATSGSREDARRATTTRPVRTVGSTSSGGTGRSATPQRRSVSSSRVSGSSPGEAAEPPAGAPQLSPARPRSDSGSSEGGGSTATGTPGSSADQRPSGAPPTPAPTSRPDTNAIENLQYPSRRR